MNTIQIIDQAIHVMQYDYQRCAMALAMPNAIRVQPPT